MHEASFFRKIWGGAVSMPIKGLFFVYLLWIKFCPSRGLTELSMGRLGSKADLRVTCIKMNFETNFKKAKQLFSISNSQISFTAQTAQPNYSLPPRRGLKLVCYLVYGRPPSNRFLRPLSFLGWRCFSKKLWLKCIWSKMLEFTKNYV